METVVDIVGNEEAKVEDSVAARNKPTPTSLQMIADPVVYQLVRVDGNGRLVPATEDEVMEVEDLLEEDKSENRFVSDSGQTVECNTNCEHDLDKLQFKASEGLPLDNVKLDDETPNVPPDPVADFEKVNVQPEQSVALLAPPADYVSIFQLEGSPKPSNGLVENETSTSAIGTSSKPDFSTLKGEIHVDNLTVKELQETFKATFGRETSVKDKQWLKRRILMGLTNSCDFSTTTLVIKDNGVVKKCKEETSNSVEHNILKDPEVGSTSENHESSPTFHDSEKESHSNATGMKLQDYPTVDNYGNEDTNTEQRATKRVRKPTKRYIEELSEGESRDSCAKLISSVGHRAYSQPSTNMHVTPVQKVGLDGRWLIRRDSLGGSGVQVPYVSRIRRSRPRENFMTLMPVTSSDKLYTERKVELEELKNLDSNENSDDDTVAMPAATGRMRRKHHRPWTLSEVVKLVEGVAKYGAGRWSEIKRLAFASYSYRTSVDLKDKWRNLLRASFAQLPAEKGMQNSRKHASIPIPAPILLRVRELAEMQAQVPPSFSASKFAGHTGSDRSGVHE
ncbi:telomere repeat-binding factor like- [Olea europaea subsp. europaea]|uniref:Telomere repeat-binding factor like n=2 Tax=Olea europaea subsp. europaea TaxID=158383 RepID=A0A8S0QGE4_OLEEU|nr:telomere repeat-binding factor like- [Olea europaea subsp. europaea]